MRVRQIIALLSLAYLFLVIKCYDTKIKNNSNNHYNNLSNGNNNDNNSTLYGFVVEYEDDDENPRISTVGVGSGNISVIGGPYERSSIGGFTSVIDPVNGIYYYYSINWDSYKHFIYGISLRGGVSCSVDLADLKYPLIVTIDPKSGEVVALFEVNQTVQINLLFVRFAPVCGKVLTKVAVSTPFYIYGMATIDPVHQRLFVSAYDPNTYVYVVLVLDSTTGDLVKVLRPASFELQLNWMGWDDKTGLVYGICRPAIQGTYDRAFVAITPLLEVSRISTISGYESPDSPLPTAALDSSNRRITTILEDLEGVGNLVNINMDTGSATKIPLARFEYIIRSLGYAN